MIEKFKIELDDSQRIYFSGDIIKGHVLLHVDAPYDLKCIVIRFVGEAKFRLPEELINEKIKSRKKRKIKNTIKKLGCNNKICPAPTKEPTNMLDQKENGDSKQKRQMRFSTETYFDKREVLFGHNYSSYREHLPTGTHSLPFNFTLPANLPTSFIGRRAYIQYYCEALLERWNKPSVAEKKFFTVSEVVDLNNNPRADMSCSVTKSTSCWLLCCPRGTILVTGRMSRQGVVCGQGLPVETDIHNMSNTNIKQSYLSIIQVTSYLNSHGFVMYEEERHVLELKNGKIPKGEIVIWPEETVLVPPLPPSSQSRTLCKIIIITYRVQIRLKLSMKGDSVSINLPLIVGNIPFRKDFKKLKYEDNNDFSEIVFPKSNKNSRILKQLPLYSVNGEQCANPNQAECTYQLPEHVPKCMIFKFQ